MTEGQGSFMLIEGPRVRRLENASLHHVLEDIPITRQKQILDVPRRPELKFCWLRASKDGLRGKTRESLQETNITGYSLD